MSKKDYYSLLGLSKGASGDDIKKAYRKLAMKYHPDQNKDDKDAEAKFKEISEAYEALKDDQERAAYDRFGHDAFAQNGGSGNRAGFGGFESQAFHGDFSDLFGDFFADAMSGSRRNRPQARMDESGADLKYNLTITLEEAFSGVEKNISFTTQEKCTTCNGKGSKSDSLVKCGQCKGQGAIRMQQGFFVIDQQCGACSGTGQIIKDPCAPCGGFGRKTGQKTVKVTIPAGIANGNKIKLSAEGESGIRGGRPGDLYIFVSIKPHELYKIDGSDLHCMIPISFKVAALGGEVEIPTIEKGTVLLTIPEGTQNGEKLKLRNKGMSKVRSTSRGDMLVHIFVEVPKNLTKTQKALLEEFESHTPKSTESSFFQKMANLWGGS
ncbi:MAG: molecular chaperone DnaJ [Alphaproteobacteria bacterium]|nr:molecular chaperone DnaJ [Alphaproteobacteria bacterium]